MAEYIQGFDDERFVSKVDRNFFCLICFSVLKDPVLCPRNQHCFCRGCITKHLENNQRCPTCADELTVGTLAEPQRMVKDYLNELNIRCVYIDRGCQEILQLQHLDQHEATCGFTPAVCTNQGCGATLNQRDLIHHESEVCEFRKLKCHSCGKMTKKLVEMEMRVERMERNLAGMEKNVATNMTSMTTNISNMDKDIATKMGNMERNVAASIERNATDVQEKLEAVKNEVAAGLNTALVKAFDEMKDVLIRVEDRIAENETNKTGTASGDRENIIVAGGEGINSVEMFNWRQRTWSPLKSMPKNRLGATSFFYNNHVAVVGGFSADTGSAHNIISMNFDSKPDPTLYWSDCPVELRAKSTYHSSALYNSQLIVVGGESGDGASDYIDEIQLVFPYATKVRSRMPKPRQFHSMEIFDDRLVIVGGSTTHKYQDSLSSVVLYDIKKNECKHLASLPYDVRLMATVRWGDNIVVIGGTDKRGKALNTVIIYNVKTEQYHMLPAMRCKRVGCSAVIIGNNIVVLGGQDEQARMLKTVEAFNFDRNTWLELPEMSVARWLHTAVVV